MTRQLNIRVLCHPPQSLNQVFLGSSKNFADELSKRLKLEEGVKLELDMTHFARKFESTMLLLENLTPHQEEKFEEMERILNETGGGRADIRAPAGAGKTYLGLKALVARLLDDTKGVMAFVSRNKALCSHVTKWLYTRLGKKLNNAEAKKRLEARFIVMYSRKQTQTENTVFDFASTPQITTPLSGMRSVHLAEGRVVVGEERHLNEALALVVIDEAHHLHSEGNLEPIVEQHVQEGTKLILLSDASQSGAAEMAAILGTKEVGLQQVVRCTQTIVAMGAQFAKKDFGVVASHAAEGPPGGTFLFDLESEDQRFDQYADVLANRAVGTLLKDYPGLSLDNRVIMVGPDEEFCHKLEQPLQEQLEQVLEGQKVRVVDANEASAAIPTNKQSKEVRFVLTPIDAADGLERLIAICVGMDKPNGGLDEGTRSRIYRSLTRGQMQVIVVNENVENGRFSFLNRIELNREAGLDQEMEMRKRVETKQIAAKKRFKKQLRIKSTSIAGLAEAIRSARAFRKVPNMLKLIVAAEELLAPLVLEGLKVGTGTASDETTLLAPKEENDGDSTVVWLPNFSKLLQMRMCVSIPLSCYRCRKRPCACFNFSWFL